jgi:hypothetical protein
MTSNLQSTFRSAESSAQVFPFAMLPGLALILPFQDALKKRTEELDHEETDIADQRVRFETERIIAFYEELSTEKVGQTTISSHCLTDGRFVI